MTVDHRARILVTADGLARELAAPSPPVVLAIRNTQPGGTPTYRGEPRIPGAVDVELPAELAGAPSRHGGARPLPAIAELQRHARRWGLRRDSRVVVYDHDRCLVAARAWWVLRWAGIADVRMLDGGFARWLAAGLPIVAASPSPTAGDVELTAGHLPQIDADAAAQMARKAVLLDSRIRPNYIGGAVPAGQAPRGHIPGAVSAPAADNLGDDGTFTDAGTLAALYGALGADGTGPVAVYCGVGISATHDIAALAIIGIEAALFCGSWSAWSSDPARPVAIGARPG
ncbi:MAG: sulfurtransferase [Alphaproteobacteria bacterium]|nr:sulfurtransferase [Alphaproteobacteria bacterium]